MKDLTLLAVLLGFLMDLALGDPRSIPHPVVLIGKSIALLETGLRRLFPKSPAGEKLAGLALWILIAGGVFGVSWGILWLCRRISPWLGFAVESVMCWQILAAKSLRTESMKVYGALKEGDLIGAREAVSWIVGRDTQRLNQAGVARAAVETVAENTSDGVVAPLLFLMIGGAPLGFFYKAVNTMDSMVGYIDPPYTHLGLAPARMDDVMNFLPARLSAILMLGAGMALGMDWENGWTVFQRDRKNHASPNSAQTEAACAGLLRIRLGGDAWYRDILHQKPAIGDPLREIEDQDIPRACRLMYGTALLALTVLAAARIAIFMAMR